VTTDYRDVTSPYLLMRCVTADARRRRVLSASQKSERPLLSHLYHSAAHSLVDDVIDHVTLQLRAFHVSRLVSNQSASAYYVDRVQRKA